ncbi:hypothetical protein [Umezawaea sp.]|uniref:hypothetical protein n=1 Tax=Umezawaea sp. TaxID=1955258 RepID=UPI002ED1BE15
MAGAHLSALGREVATRLATAEGADAAFVAGGTAVGLGSGSSDLDVYLAGPGMRESRRQLFADGVRVDVQTLATERLDDLVDGVVADYPAPARGRVPDADVALAVRLLTADVVTDTGGLAALRERLASRPLPLRRRVISGWARTAYSAVEDVAGLRGSTDRLDLDAASTAGHRALLAAGKAVAAACGDLHHGEKWVWHQLARSAPASFPLARYRRLVHHAAPEPGDPDLFADLASFVQTCLVAAMTLGWWDVPLHHWPGWVDEGGPLRRAAFFVPCASDAATVIVGPGARLFRAPPEALLVWGLCNGAPVDRVAGRAAALGPLAEPWSGVTGTRCRAVLRELEDAALIIGAHLED